MPCNPISGQTPEGGRYFGFACTRGKRQANLGTCQTGGCSAPAEILCDWPKDGKTCDRKVCRRCAHRVGPNKDYCPEHWVESTKSGAAF